MITEQELTQALKQASPEDANIVRSLWETRSVAKTAAALHLTAGRVKHRCLRTLKQNEAFAQRFLDGLA
jgi:hypothetical protein